MAVSRDQIAIGTLAVFFKVRSDSPVSVHKHANEHSDVLGYRSNGEEERGRQMGDWVELVEQQGYIAATSPSTGMRCLEPCSTWSVISPVNVRDNNSTGPQSHIVGKKSAGDKVFGWQVGTWVELVDSQGYIAVAGLTVEAMGVEADRAADPARAHPLRWKVVAQNPVNIRRHARMDSEAVGTRTNGDIVNGWQVGEWVELVDNLGYIVVKNPRTGNLLLERCGTGDALSIDGGRAGAPTQISRGSDDMMRIEVDHAGTPTQAPLRWKVVAHNPVNIRRHARLGSEAVGTRSNGDIVNGWQVGDLAKGWWVELVDNLGYIAVTNPDTGNRLLTEDAVRHDGGRARARSSSYQHQLSGRSAFELDMGSGLQQRQGRALHNVGTPRVGVEDARRSSAPPSAGTSEQTGTRLDVAADRSRHREFNREGVLEVFGSVQAFGFDDVLQKLTLTPQDLRSKRLLVEGPAPSTPAGQAAARQRAKLDLIMLKSLIVRTYNERSENKAISALEALEFRVELKSKESDMDGMECTRSEQLRTVLGGNLNKPDSIITDENKGNFSTDVDLSNLGMSELQFRLVRLPVLRLTATVVPSLLGRGGAPVPLRFNCPSTATWDELRHVLVMLLASPDVGRRQQMRDKLGVSSPTWPGSISALPQVQMEFSINFLDFPKQGAPKEIAVEQSRPGMTESVPNLDARHLVSQDRNVANFMTEGVAPEYVRQLVLQPCQNTSVREFPGAYVVQDAIDDARANPDFTVYLADLREPKDPQVIKISPVQVPPSRGKTDFQPRGRASGQAMTTSHQQISFAEATRNMTTSQKLSYAEASMGAPMERVVVIREELLSGRLKNHVVASFNQHVASLTDTKLDTNVGRQSGYAQGGSYGPIICRCDELTAKARARRHDDGLQLEESGKSAHPWEQIGGQEALEFHYMSRRKNPFQRVCREDGAKTSPHLPSTQHGFDSIQNIITGRLQPNAIMRLAKDQPSPNTDDAGSENFMMLVRTGLLRFEIGVHYKNCEDAIFFRSNINAESTVRAVLRTLVGALNFFSGQVSVNGMGSWSTRTGRGGERQRREQPPQLSDPDANRVYGFFFGFASEQNVPLESRKLWPELQRHRGRGSTSGPSAGCSETKQFFDEAKAARNALQNLDHEQLEIVLIQSELAGEMGATDLSGASRDGHSHSSGRGSGHSSGRGSGHGHGSGRSTHQHDAELFHVSTLVKLKPEHDLNLIQRFVNATMTRVILGRDSRAGAPQSLQVKYFWRMHLNDEQKAIFDREPAKKVNYEQLHGVETICPDDIGKWTTQKVLEEQKRDMQHLFDLTNITDQNPTEALFWHGTTWTSLLKILDAGMQIVRSAHAGRAYGNGLYMSDALGKALQYSEPMRGRDDERSFQRLVKIVGRPKAQALENHRPFLVLRAKPGRLMKMVGWGADRSWEKKAEHFGVDALGVDFDGVYVERPRSYREIVLFNPARVIIVGVVWMLG